MRPKRSLAARECGADLSRLSHLDAVHHGPCSRAVDLLGDAMRPVLVYVEESDVRTCLPKTDRRCSPHAARSARHYRRLAREIHALPPVERPKR